MKKDIIRSITQQVLEMFLPISSRTVTPLVDYLIDDNAAADRTMQQSGAAS